MRFDWRSFLGSEIDEHAAVMAAVRRDLAEPFGRMLEVWVLAVRGGNKILFFGNGGSAGDAQHLATELVVRYTKDRAPIAAIALTTDSSALTAGGNDLGFDKIFARQLQALARPGDVAVAITTSGKSPNVIAGLRAARALGAAATAFTGNTGGELHGLADPMLIVPASTTARIQEMHIMLGHLLCGALELELGLV
jgi:D-sedoheptulose 7-phosphate isomerase